MAASATASRLPPLGLLCALIISPNTVSLSASAQAFPHWGHLLFPSRLNLSLPWAWPAPLTAPPTHPGICYLISPSLSLV